MTTAKTKKTAPKKRLSVQTFDPEIQKKMLAYRDQLASGNDPIQEGADYKEKYKQLKNDNAALGKLGTSEPIKQKTLNEKQAQITGLLHEARSQSSLIYFRLHKLFKGTEPTPIKWELDEMRSIHQWMNKTAGVAIHNAEVNHKIIQLLNENL